MLPYFILLLIIITISIFRKKIGDEKYLKIIFAILFVFLILKDYKSFPDHEYYLETFNCMCKKGLIKTLELYDYEIGYMLYNFVISLFTNNYYVFLIITGFIALIGPYIFIKRNSPNYLISIFIFIALNFYSMNFYVLRASIGLSVFLIGFNYIKEKKLWKFMGMTILAGMFHKSLFVFLPFYFLLNVNYSKKMIKILSIILMIIFIFRESIVTFFVETIYRDYQSFVANDTGFKLLLVIIIIAVFFMYNKDKLLKNDKNLLIYINMIFYGIIFQMLSTVVGPINRMTTYFLASLIILIPKYISIIKNDKQKRFLETMTIIVGIMLFCLKVIQGTSLCNYQFFWL